MLKHDRPTSCLNANINLTVGMFACMVFLAAADLHSSNSSQSFDQQQDISSSSGKCPFLAALPTPPPAQNAFWRRLQQLFGPADYQKEALGPHSMVAAPKQVR
jgi:hypothetical protein